MIDLRLRSSSLDRAGVDDLAAVLAGAGADVDDVVGDPDRVLVVLDDEHRVAELAQADERVDQPAVVALVQPDRRLVEHVQHADQAASRSATASRMRWASPPASVPAERRQREVVEARRRAGSPCGR